VALGIAVKTYFDDVGPNETAQSKAIRRDKFPEKYVPYASAFSEDLDIACQFFDALYAGVKTLDTAELTAADRAVWDKAAEYLALRR